MAAVASSRGLVPNETSTMNGNVYMGDETALMNVSMQWKYRFSFIIDCFEDNIIQMLTGKTFRTLGEGCFHSGGLSRST